MTGPIFFNVKEARERLLRTGEVLTLRKRRGTGRTVAYQGNRRSRKRLCAVIIDFAWHNPSIRLLEENLEGSGFQTLEAWMEAASPESTVLYRVRRTGP